MSNKQDFLEEAVADALKHQPDMTQTKEHPVAEWQRREVEKALRELRRDMWQWRDD